MGNNMQALEWHPDKNIHRSEEANQMFTLIGQAYEVLSDDHERAWYDSHRDAILRGDDPSAPGNQENSSTPSAPTGVTPTSSLMRFFSSSCYNGFDVSRDPKANFFAIYSQLFDKLVREELDWLRVDQDARPSFEPFILPSFGLHSDHFDDKLASFYNFWTGFSTVKSFRWFDKYNLRDAPDRFARRQMEKHNKKARETPRREFNDTVRTLAEFVKKRDPRYKAYQEEQDKIQKLKKEEMKKKQEDEKLARLQDIQDYEEQDWAKVDDDSHLDFWEDEEIIECIVCDKVFKNEKQVREFFWYNS